MKAILSGQVNFRALCAQGTLDDQYMCIEGAIERMAKYDHEKSLQQCNTFSGWHRNLCLKGAERKMYSLNKSFELYR